MLACGAEKRSDAWYYGDRKEIVLSIGRNAATVQCDAGQRTMSASVADIAIKMVTQNNFLVPPEELKAEDQPSPRMAQTPGVVLIDELDVHLHPKWQRGVVETLRNLVPPIFISTTHSPFIVQSVAGRRTRQSARAVSSSVG